MSAASRFILWLDNTEGCVAPRAGNKAAHLSTLLKHGFTVPAGFVISAEACPAGPDTTQERTLPPELEEAVLAAYRILAREDSAAVAVRSSSTAEDLPGHSFAGQYETFLEVRGETDLIRAVEGCWASLSSPRAVAYREMQCISGDAMAMAVLVQRMAPAEVSGVLFTVNPVTHQRDEILINAAPGLGEALVSGRVTPDQYVVNRGSGTSAATLSGGTAVLGPARIQELVRIAKDIEAVFGAPQDIEWCWGDGRLHILQSRPITTLGRSLPYDVDWGNPANEELSHGQVIFWSNWNTRENMPYPLKPLAWSFFRDLLAPETMGALWGIDESSPLYPYNFGIDLVNGRAYWNMNVVLGHPFLGPVLRRALKHLDHEAGEAFEHLAATGEFMPAKLPIKRIDMVKPALLGIWTSLRFPWLTSSKGLQRRCDAFSELAVRYESTPLEGKAIPELIAEVRAFSRVAARVAFPLLAMSFKGMVAAEVIKRMVRRWKDLHLADLWAGMEGNKTMETALELYRLSRAPDRVRMVYLECETAEVERRLRDFPEGREFLADLERWLAIYGHRGSKDLDLGYPSWREDPSYVHQMLKAYMQLGPADPDPLKQYQETVRKRDALRMEIEKRLSAGFLSRIFPLRRWLFRRMFRLVHEFFPWRENEKFYGVKLFPGSRRIMSEIGRRYVDQGWLENAEDIYFLSVIELEAQEGRQLLASGEIQRRVQERKARWLLQIEQEAPFIARSDGKPYETHAAQVQGDCLNGLAASGGRVTGIARIIREPSEAHRFGKGEILVAPTTEPGWAPLFLLARGLVMEVGGPICHGAIVAREYGIPAVVGVREATKRIKDGDRITVDGFMGEVLIQR